MAGTGEATGNGGGETLSVEDQVLEILSNARRVLAEGSEKFGTLRGNPQAALLKQAVGELGTEHLVDLIAGKPVAEIDAGESSQVKFRAGLWSAQETGRKLHNLARPLYIADQNRTIAGLLGGRKITVTPREDAEPYSLTASRAGLESEVARSITGYFEEGVVELGGFKLTPEEGDRDVLDPVDYWVAKVFGTGTKTDQQLDFRIED